MLFSRLRRYDVQATWACALALLSVPPALVAVVIALRNYQHELGQIVYGAKGMFLPVFAAALLLSLIPGSVGMLLGISSAGQRRNEKPGRSWIGFFVGGSVLTLDIILMIAFWLLRLQQPA